MFIANEKTTKMYTEKLKLFESQMQDFINDFRPSSAMFATRCKKFLTLKSLKSKNAVLGSKLHEDVYNILFDFYKNKVPIKHEDAFILSYLQYIEKYLKFDKSALISLEMPIISNFYTDYIKGTPDFYFYKDKKLTILDLKTGTNVDEFSLLQLKTYAFMICDFFLLEPEKITLVVYGRTITVRDDIDFQQLRQFKIQLRKDIDNAPIYAEEETCLNCHKIAICNHGIEYLKKNRETLSQIAPTTFNEVLDNYHKLDKIKAKTESVLNLYQELLNEEVPKRMTFDKIQQLKDEIEIKETNRRSWLDVPKEVLEKYGERGMPSVKKAEVLKLEKYIQNKKTFKFVPKRPMMNVPTTEEFLDKIEAYNEEIGKELKQINMAKIVKENEST